MSSTGFSFPEILCTCFQRNSIFSFRKVISQQSNREQCPGYSFSEPIFQSQFVLWEAEKTRRGINPVYLVSTALLHCSSPGSGCSDACAESRWKEVRGVRRGELWARVQCSWMQPTARSLSPAASDGFTIPALHWVWYQHTHHSNSMYFLLIAPKIRGESWESKAKGDKVSYFLGCFCADKKLILIKPTLKSFHPM